jgi:hypothetical protein
MKSTRMQKTLLLLAIMICFIAVAQQAARKPLPVVKPATIALPLHIYNNLHDSCTSLDIVFLTGKGGSMSLDGRNVKFFTSFLSAKTADKKPSITQDGTIMWEQDGREYLSGAIYFTADSAGYIQFTKDSKEYVNALTPAGAAFLHTHGK